jgi:hypothetical protein
MLITLILVPFVGIPLLLVVGQLIRPVQPIRDIESSQWSMRDFRRYED